MTNRPIFFHLLCSPHHDYASLIRFDTHTLPHSHRHPYIYLSSPRRFLAIICRWVSIFHCYLPHHVDSPNLLPGQSIFFCVTFFSLPFLFSFFCSIGFPSSQLMHSIPPHPAPSSRQHIDIISYQHEARSTPHTAHIAHHTAITDSSQDSEDSKRIHRGGLFTRSAPADFGVVRRRTSAGSNPTNPMGSGPLIACGQPPKVDTQNRDRQIVS